MLLGNQNASKSTAEWGKYTQLKKIFFTEILTLTSRP